jgi:hypothetical protein
MLVRMIGKGTGLVAGALMVVTTAAPEAARACSGPPHCPNAPWVRMIGDAAVRPTNTCVIVDYQVRGSRFEAVRETIESGLAFVAPDGSRVPLAPTEWSRYYCPTLELAPDTDYTLVGPEYDVCDLVGEATLATFRTGAGPDHTPPSTPGAVDDVSCRIVRCNSGACCGPYVVTVYESQWAPSTDDLGAVAYVFGGEVRFGESHEWYRPTARGPMFGFAGRAEGLVPYEVRAIDGSGNTSAPAVEGRSCTVVEDDAAVPSDASVTPRDAFVAAALDAGVTSDAGSGERPAGSCSARVPHDETPTPVVLGVLALVGLVSCRRRPRA